MQQSSYRLFLHQHLPGDTNNVKAEGWRNLTATFECVNDPYVFLGKFLKLGALMISQSTLELFQTFILDRICQTFLGILTATALLFNGFPKG
jgi:hypothetical protein